jgi:hypothetical protein
MHPMITILPEASQTRILATVDGQEVLKAVLPPAHTAHPMAARTMLEGLALWHQQRLCVVLCADERDTGSFALGLLDALGFGERSLHFDVAVVPRGRRVHYRRIVGLGDFSELRRLTSEVLR